MQRFTAERDASTPDEFWLTEHPPVFTQGLAGKPEHLLRDLGIPVVNIDRGGQVTYHGPGQAVVYLLLDLSRRGLKVRQLVHRIEQAVIDLLAGCGLRGERLDRGRIDVERRIVERAGLAAQPPGDGVIDERRRQGAGLAGHR